MLIVLGMYCEWQSAGVHNSVLKRLCVVSVLHLGSLTTKLSEYIIKDVLFHFLIS